jgi:hypothetical protein
MAPSEIHKALMARNIQFCCHILHFLIGQIKKYFIKLNVISEIYKTNINRKNFSAFTLNTSLFQLKLVLQNTFMRD